MRKIKTNLIFGIISLMCGLILLFVIPAQISVSSMVQEYVNGRFIPLIMAVLMIVCGGIGIAQSLLLKKEAVKEIDFSGERKNIVFLLMVLIYGILAKNISFMLASILFSGVSLYYVGCRKPKRYAVVFLVVVTVCLLFKYGLKVQFGGWMGV